ncbi:hypothetical protein C6361_08390 [Plantactinospora sp. BC1]|uniref:hypothetical protein n=1 Tax=Plantactinospora sp. BC1 TaxID=2108470 RepID=UPI000D171217|nr:hypothetical protein [Plantactinospora sp. BC1]AVT29510.1 hypothetical protein C6361_08390 [Plantactinospora sp. BC1]
MDTIDSVMAEAERAWRAYGVGRADRAALAADLRLDLEAAAADGGDPAQLLGGDVTGFARRLADEAGVQRVRRHYGPLLGTALTGAVLGAVLGYAALALLYPMFVRAVDIPRSIEIPIQLAVVVYYGVPAAVVVTGAVVAVRLWLPEVPRIRRTSRLMGLLLPVAGILVTPLTMAFAWSTDYSTAPEVVVTEIAIVLAALGGATILARRLSLRDSREPSDTTGPYSAQVNSA